MGIQDSTIRQLLRIHFLGKSPLRVAESEREPLSQAIHQRLASMSYVRHQNAFYYGSGRDREQFVCALWVDLPGDRSWRDFHVVLNRNQTEELTITYRENKALVATLDEVVAFARACQELAEQRHALQKKEQKIRELKTQAILAQVKKLAREEKFAFYARTRSRKLELYIKLTDIEYVELTIPFSKFQEAVPLVRTALQQLRILYKTGIRFRLGQRSPFERRGNQGWITPESLEQDSASSARYGVNTNQVSQRNLVCL